MEKNHSQQETILPKNVRNQNERKLRHLLRVRKTHQEEETCHCMVKILPKEILRLCQRTPRLLSQGNHQTCQQRLEKHFGGGKSQTLKRL